MFTDFELRCSLQQLRMLVADRLNSYVSQAYRKRPNQHGFGVCARQGSSLDLLFHDIVIEGNDRFSSHMVASRPLREVLHLSMLIGGIAI